MDRNEIAIAFSRFHERYDLNGTSLSEEVADFYLAQSAKQQAENRALREVATKILKVWHHFEAHDDGDRGWIELGDELEAALDKLKGTEE